MQSILSILKNYKYILLLFTCLLSSMMMAEVVVLNSGQRIQGEITLLNEDVVIIKKKDGSRYQYPRSEVQSIQEDQTVNTTTTTPESTTVNRKVAVRIQAYGGAVYLPNKGWGGQIGADLILGSKKIGTTPILVGGSVGFRTKILPEENYTFIPIQAVVSMPLIPKQHAPHICMSLGYGCSTNKATKGGICLSASAGWTYQVNSNLALLLSACAEWQNTHTEITEIINKQEYTNNVGCNFITIEATIGIQF